MATAVYGLCAATSLACAVLLLRAYFRERGRLALYCALCFSGLATNNVLLFADVFLSLDIEVWRKIPAVLGVMLLLHGFISEAR